MKNFGISTKHLAGAGAALLWLFTACATQPKAKREAIFFPPPPDEPRIQFLTSFGSESDLRQDAKFADFVMGAEKMHRPIWKPYGLAVTKGSVYVCDTQAGNLGVVNLLKGRIRFIRPTGREAFQVPINVAVDADGICYVTDSKRGQVRIFNSQDLTQGAIGREGEMKPCGIAVHGKRLYVSDLMARNIRVYDTATREQLFAFPPSTAGEQEKLHAPTNLATDKDGKVYVSDTGGFTTKIYEADGKFIRSVGEQGLEPGRFALPKGIAVDREGRSYVVDGATAVVQMFDNQGRLLMYFGEPKSSGPAGLYLPAGIAIDYQNLDLYQKYVAPGFTLEHLIFVTNQAGAQKVSVYGFVRKG